MTDKIDISIPEILKKYPASERDNLLAILQEIQVQWGFIPESAIVLIGKHLKLPESKIYGIASFYNEFSFKPRGKYHIRICVGTGCHLSGSADLVRAFEKHLGVKCNNTTKDGLFSIETVPCIGACGLSPIVEVNGQYHHGVSISDVSDIIENYSLSLL